jgi:hypothetical protein
MNVRAKIPSLVLSSVLVLGLGSIGCSDDDDSSSTTQNVEGTATLPGDPSAPDVTAPHDASTKFDFTAATFP